MPKFKVSVVKRMYATGSIEVEADSAEEAEEIIEEQIESGELKTTDINWSEHQYEDSTFETTGDVEEPNKAL